MILDEIIEKKNERIKERKKEISLNEIYDLAIKINKNNSVNKFKEILSKVGLSVIGEFKKASPSKGIIVDKFSISDILDVYKKLNIDAYSVLTEEDYFKGNDKYLEFIEKNSHRPILRKDFVVDMYQVYESKVLGASGILLIVAALGERIGEFYNECRKLNLYPLVEVHNEDELNIALKYDVEIIGINNRDLKTFKTTLETTEKLIKSIPKNKIVISESGIKTIEDLKMVESLGVDGVLIGEMFMRNLENKKFYKKYLDFIGNKKC